MKFGHVADAVSILNHQVRFFRIFRFIAYAAPIALLMGDSLQGTPATVWHDLWEISTTVIGTLILMLVRDYMNKQKELNRAIQDIKADRDNMAADLHLSYAKELGLLKKRQDKLVEVLVQVVFKVHPDAGADMQKIVRELMDSGG